MLILWGFFFRGGFRQLWSDRSETWSDVCSVSPLLWYQVSAGLGPYIKSQPTPFCLPRPQPYWDLGGFANYGRIGLKLGYMVLVYHLCYSIKFQPNRCHRSKVTLLMLFQWGFSYMEVPYDRCADFIHAMIMQIFCRFGYRVAPSCVLGLRVAIFLNLSGVYRFRINRIFLIYGGPIRSI